MRDAIDSLYGRGGHVEQERSIIAGDRMTRLEGIRPGGRGEIASSNLSRRRATRRKKRSERGEKVRRQSGRFFNRLAGGGGERARQTLV